MTDVNTRPIEILIIDDSDMDVELLRRVLMKMPVEKNIHRVEHGEAGLSYLRCEPPYEEARRPDLVLLDLNMPGLNGHEVLQVVKNDPDLASIPVVVMTNSEHWVDVKKSYENYCNGYLNKPFAFKDLVNMIGALSSFWFAAVELPPQTADVAGRPMKDPHSAFNTQGSKVRILLVEDNPLDAESVCVAVEDLGFKHPVVVATSGEEALDMLRDGSISPDLILLDLNLPGASGQDVLQKIKEDGELRRIQVIAFTSKHHDDAALEMYLQHADAYVLKPQSREELNKIFASIAYWHSVVYTATNMAG